MSSKSLQLTVLSNLALSVFFVLLEGVSTFGEVTFNPVPVLLSSLGKLLSTGRFIELGCEIFGFFLLSFSQNERKMY